MVVIDEHHDHDIGESSMSHDPHDMGESSMHRDAQVDNQIVILPEDLQHPDDSDEFWPTPNGTPYWVPDVPEDEKPKKGKPRRSKEVNTLNEVDGKDVEIPGNKKRKRMTKSQTINYPVKLCLKRIIGIETYMVLDFVETHNHPLMNLNNMDLSKARRQLHFDDYIFIHRASLSNLGPTRAHRLKVTPGGGYDKVRGTSTYYCNFKRCMNSFIGDRDAQMLVDKMYQDGALRNTVVKMFPDSHHRLCMWHITEKLPGKVYSHEGNTLVQFMLCFESAMEKQRYTKRVLDNASNGSTPSIFTELPFEKHVCAVYTPSIFREVQHEIRKSLYARTQIRNHSEGGFETCIIRHRDKRSNTVIDATVVLNQMDASVTCSCGHYNRHGFLCRHVFCVFHIYGIDKIPDAYLNRRWTKNVLPAHLLDKRHRYDPCIEETDTLASQLEDETQTPNVKPNKEALYANLLGVTVPDKVVIKTPRSIFRRRIACGEASHHKGICKKFPNQDKDEFDDEDEGDNEDEVDDEDEVDNEDELDDEDEEYESEEE
ncbi:FAR1-related sequence 5-like protein [Tanacetum coccineum]